jgi:tetratricopeptide (TPR) repeat protein
MRAGSGVRHESQQAMKMLKTVHAIFVLALLAVAVRQPAVAQDTTLRAKVQFFISYYEDGEYKKAADSLSSLLPSLSDSANELAAFKYIGFSYAMLNWVDKAKGTFKIALGKFPNMDIDTLEVPPNIAIVFKQAKLEKRLERLDTVSLQKPVIVVQRKNVVLPTILLSVSIVSAAAAGELFYNGFQQYKNYTSVSTPDQSVLDSYYTQARNAYIGGAVCAAVTAVLLPVSIYLYVKKEPPAKLKVSFVNGWPAVAWLF